WTLSSGVNTFTAIATDSSSRKDTNTVSVNLPISAGFPYDLNGNMTSDGQGTFPYDAENQLARVAISGARKTEFVYDGLQRLRVRKESIWSGSAWVLAGETRYLYDGRLVIQERNINNTPTVTYARGLDLSGSLDGAGGIGGLIARTDHANGVSAFY